MSRLAAANIFPVKGARPATADGERIRTLQTTHHGFEVRGIGDREVYAVAGDTAGRLMVLTPRGQAQAGGPAHRHPGDRNLKRIEVDIIGHRQMRLSVAGIAAVALDLDRPGVSTPAALHSGQVWGYDLGETAAEFACAVTGRPDAALMCVDRDKLRLVGPNQFRSSRAADSQPYSLANAASLAALNGLRKQGQRENPDVPMDRYRPNIEVGNLGDAGPFAEDRVRRLLVGDQVFLAAAAIQRCVVTNMDQDGAMVGGGLNLLSARRGHRVREDGIPEVGRPEPLFCVSLNLEQGQFGGTVTVGAPVKVLEWGESNVAFS